MEVLKKRRAVYRSAFTRVSKQFEQVLSAKEVDITEAEALRDICQEKFDALKINDDEMFDAMIAAEASEDELTAEMSICDEYKLKFTRLNVRFNKLSFERSEVLSGNGGSMNDAGQSGYSVTNQRRFKLPQIELIKFSGDVREWLPFWSSFKKIHDAIDVPPEDKFQYLLSAVTQKTRARDLVESFPATADNYEKVIESLKARFGREDLLVEVYVRELLRLVLNNAMSNNLKCAMSTLYDKIETQLRALETLGVNTDTCSAMLYPLVESCLPEELLRVWQRSSEFSDNPDATIANRLERLMKFLKAEVEGAERISLAMEGFSLGTADSKPKRSKSKSWEENIPTAAGLINNSAAAKCVFCDGDNHMSEKCFKAQKLSYEDRKNALVKKRACFKCANVGHPSRKCRARLRCVMCGGPHLVLLCPNLSEKVDSNKKTEVSPSNENKNSVTKEMGLANHSDTRVFLQTLVVKIRNESSEKEVRAIIDTGSQRSYISKHVAQDLQYQSKRVEGIVHALFGGTQTAEQKHFCYDVRLVSLDGKFACKFEALDQPVICNDIPSVDTGVWTNELKAANIQVTDTRGRQPIAVLIGADIAGKIFTGVRKVLPCGLIAMETLLGWVLMGKTPGQREDRNSTMTVTNMLNKDASIAALWQLDVLGITDPGEKKTKNELHLATKKLFEETISVTSEGRYEVVLPWLEGHPPLPSNYELASKRLESTENKLKKSGNWEKYNEIFSEWLIDEIIEEVPSEEVDKQSHYLPHRPVIKEASTTKIRPVFDASAREKNKPSLNDCLEKGINLIEQIPAILLRFRRDQIGVTADIKKAFLQIGLYTKDRDFLRFLWKTVDNEIKVFRHRRVVFGVNVSPFLLGATIEHHLNKSLGSCEEKNLKCSKQTIETLLESFYVDNCVTSMPNTKALEQFMIEATEVMAEAKFDLRGWEYSGKSDEENTTVPILGLIWDKSADTLAINYAQEFENKVITKRIILSCAQRIFDPIGFTSPATICPKLLLQKMWTEKIGWDEEVKEESREKFERWRAELPFLVEIRIPRWIHLNEAKNLTLHIFCDASKSAYAAVIFLRIEDENSVKIQLLQSKARIAPIKEMTIPRLELMAATIGARLGSEVQKTLGKNLPTIYWSDSTTVFSWIQQTEEWAIFVGNRVQEIRSLTDVNHWRHIPGEQNPADLPSRGCTPKQLAESKWWEGPGWLYEEENKWPQKEVRCNQEEIEKEKKKAVVSTILNVNETSQIYKYFSKYQNNVRVIAWMYRFVYNCRNKSHLKQGELSVEEIENAEKKLIRLIQQESFHEKDNRLATLNVVRDEEGILRLETKVSRREDLQTFCYPYILPGQHVVVKRLIFDAHVKHSHVGIQGLLSILREKYWILGGRRIIRTVISACKRCRRYTAKGFEANTPPLPMDRIKEAACFEVTGVDFAGPLYLRDNKKAWICLFTCAVYRAVHLEVVTTLSTAGFLQAFRRFISRRGRPHVMYSDNGTNFVGAENIFSQQDWKEIEKYSSEHRICWRFNPPAAPWWGGWWERLIGMLKQLLRKVLGRAHLSGEELYTTLCDCEAVINSRPLTYVSSDSDDLIPLTPVMFLRELRESGVPDCDLADTYDLNKRFRYVQRVREDLRKRFRSEYLGQLRQVMNTKNSRQVNLNEIVLIGNDNCKRLDWPLGKVVELFPGKDNTTRLVRVQTQHGQMLRPIQRLYPLEGIETSRATDNDDIPGSGAVDTEGSIDPGASTDPGTSEVKCSEVPSGKVSRFGRKLKRPERLGYN